MTGYNNGEQSPDAGSGVYVLSHEEETAIDEALRSGVASDEEVAAFWMRHGVGRSKRPSGVQAKRL
jgi:hypothetical protein